MKKKNIIKIALFVLLLFVGDYIGSCILRGGLDRMYGINQHSSILIVGHSHVMMGLDRETMERELGCKITKYTRSGVNIHERHLMVRQYLESPYSDSLKIAILGVDPFTFTSKGLSTNSYTLFFPFIDNDNIAEYVRHSTTPLNYYAHRLFRLSRYASDDLLTASFRGWKGDDKNYKTTTLTQDFWNRRKDAWNRDILFSPYLMCELEECINGLINRGVHVILLNTPTACLLNETHPREYQRIMAYYQSLAAKSHMVDFINFSPSYSHDFSLFFDPIHLNRRGQDIITKEMVEKIKQKKYLHK